MNLPPIPLQRYQQTMGKTILPKSIKNFISKIKKNKFEDIGRVESQTTTKKHKPKPKDSQTKHLLQHMKPVMLLTDEQVKNHPEFKGMKLPDVKQMCKNLGITCGKQTKLVLMRQALFFLTTLYFP